MMWWDGSSGPWYGMIFGPLMMIALVVLTVVVVTWVLPQRRLRWTYFRSASHEARSIARNMRNASSSYLVRGRDTAIARKRTQALGQRNRVLRGDLL